MQIWQNADININNIKDPAAFLEFMKKNGGVLADKIDDDIADTLNIRIEETYEMFVYFVKTLKGIVVKFPQITMNVSGEEECSNSGECIEYEITYKDRTMTVATTETFYKWYPCDYEEFVEICEEFEINDVMGKEQWEALDEESDNNWYFIEGKEAKTSIELSKKKIIHI